MTYPKEVDETIGIPMEVEPLEHMKLEDLGLNTCSQDLFPNFKEFPSVDEPEPQPLPNLLFLDVNLEDKRGTDPLINPYSSGSFRMNDEEDVPKVKTVEMFNKPSFAKINFVKSTKQVKSPRKTSVDKNRQNTPSPRGNKRNWNQQMSQRLGSDFEMFNKACHVCGSFEHLRKDCNNWSGPISLNTARPVNTVQPRTAVNNVGPMPNAVVNIARPKLVLSAVNLNKGNAVKSLACWVWRPKHKVLDHGNPYQDLKDKGVIDSGCSRHMTGNRSYLTDYEEIKGGFVTFGGNSKGGKITRKGIENLIDLKDTLPIAKHSEGSGPNWLFDIDALTKSMNYKLVIIGNQSNCNAGTKACDDAGFSDAGLNFREDEKKVTKANQKRKLSNMPNQRFVYSDDDEDVGAEADMNNLDAFMPVSPILTTRIHKDHPVKQIIGDIHSAPQTRRMTKRLTEHAMFSSVQQRTNHKDFQNCLFACFLSQAEPEVSVGCQKPGHLAARLGCAETKVATWDDLAFKLIILRCEYCKNHKKTVKTGQTQTRERKSTQKAERKLSKSNCGQPSVNLVNKSQGHLRTKYQNFPNQSLKIIQIAKIALKS
ncbi:hypothetical protein Tco_0431512 [Tanacetum coccineum]